MFATVLAIALAQVVDAPSVDLLNPPMRNSTSADVLQAWNACADAVEGQDLRVDTTKLRALGWDNLTTVAKQSRTKINWVFAKSGNQSIITVTEKACFVDCVTTQADLIDQIEPQIADRLRGIAAKRGVKYERWVSNDVSRHSAKPFTVALSKESGDSIMTRLSKSSDSSIFINILSVDAFRSK